MIHQEESERISVHPDIVTKVFEEDTVTHLKLGKTYFDKSMNENNFSIAFEWLSRSAEQGHMDAQFRLGDLYALGHGTLKSLSDAYKWYTKAAIQGYKRALVRIHNLYQSDIQMHCRGKVNSEEQKWKDTIYCSSARDLTEYRLKVDAPILNYAIDYFTGQFKQYQSSNQEDPVVQLNLAFLYQHGYGIKKCIRWAFEYYSLAAELGNTDAQYHLGHLYQKHTDKKFNYRHALKWYIKFAQGGNIAAQRSLAYLYLKGLATNINSKSALFWYTKAAEAGDSASQVILGKLYRKGDCVEKDLSTAVKWYSQAARQGNVVARNCLAQLYQRDMLDNIELDEDMTEYLTEDSMNSRLCTKLSLDVSKLGDSLKLKQLNELSKRALIGDGQAMYEIGLKYLEGDKGFAQYSDAGIKWIKKAANAKHKGAQFMIADLYKKGDLVEKDYHKTAIWYKTLAKQKDADGQCHVGIMYNEGLGVRKDPLEASKWFMWAADQGNSDGQYYLSWLRFLGRGLGQDGPEGLKWLFKSAHQGNIQACCDLGKFYYDGEYGLEQDIDIGIKLMDYAANNGCMQAQLRLSYLYNCGDPVEEKVVKYLKMASDAGSAESQYELAIKYLHGDGIDQDYINAYILFKQAYDQGHVEARWILKYDLTLHYIHHDVPKALYMFIELTEKGSGDFHFHIGFTYEQGIIFYERRLVGINYSKAIEWYLAASKRGDSRADYRLGIMCEEGRSAEKNLNTAMSYYNKVSIEGNSDASYRFGCLYSKDDSTTQDLMTAFHYYTTASNLGHQKASKALIISARVGRFLFDGDDDDDDDDLQIDITEETKVGMLEKATEKGFSRLQYQIGAWYENKNNHFKAFEWLSLAADIGVTDAYYRLGTFYDEGNGVDQDYTMAARMYHKAVKKDHEDACYHLGRLYLYGDGVRHDNLKAYHFFKKASDMGHIEALKFLNITLETKIDSNRVTEENFFDPSSKEYQYSLEMCEAIAEHGDTEVQFKVGFAYEYINPEPNYMKAHKWYSLAAESAHGEATYRLGLLYDKGLGVSQDFQKATQLYYQASNLGSGDAFYQLGNVYKYGKAIEIDPVKAMEYYTHAANQGIPRYQFELGRFYEEGELTQKNPLESLKWYTKAYLQGYDASSSELSVMYEDKPYEDLFFKKLLRNLSIASCGNFNLTADYTHKDYFGVNYRLGNLYFFGQGTKKDLKKAWEYFIRVYVKRNRSFSMEYFLRKLDGLSSSEKCNILKEFAEDVLVLNTMKDEQLYELGMMFLNGSSQDGTVIEKNCSKAFKCLEKAVDKQHTLAALELGIMYQCGHGVKKNIIRGEELFKYAASKDFHYSEYIAVLYHTHKDFQNFTKAFEWYERLEKLVDKEDPDELHAITYHICYELSQIGFGLLFEYGDGVQQDYQKAIEYYERLAYDGNAIGPHRLGLMYYYGKGLPVDYKMAFDLFDDISSGNVNSINIPFVYDQNDSDKSESRRYREYRVMYDVELYTEAEYYMGLMYKNGLGVPRDEEKAQHYFVDAYNGGCDRAKHELEEFEL